MKRILLLRIATDPVTRICSGVAPIIVPAGGADFVPARYVGGGSLVEVPELEHIINGDSQQITVTVSGVSRATVGLFEDEIEALQGAAVNVGVAYQDDDWQITEVEWLAELRCDAPTAAGTHTSRSISLSLGTNTTDRSKAPVAFWSAAGQAKKSPSDRFFDHKASINQGTSRRFGPND